LETILFVPPPTDANMETILASPPHPAEPLPSPMPIQQRPIQFINCAACGLRISPQAANCPSCGHPVRADGSDKRILPAIILCLFLGVFGAHAFYAGRNKQGIAIIGCLLSPVVVSLASPGIGSRFWGVFSVCFWFALILLVLMIVHVISDLVRILVGAYKDGQGRKITKWT